MAGLTLDTGALIAYERRDRSLMALLKAASQDEKTLTIPTVAIAEAYRGTNKRLLQTLLDAAIVEPLSELLARSAGEAQAKVKGATTIDAVVAASAAQREDHVVTSDPRDMRNLRAHFRSLRVVAL
jgi:predicted nucleic acid-binding protein